MNSWDWRKEHGVTVGISVAGCIVSNGEAVEQMSAESWDRLDKVDAQTLLMIHWDNAAEFVIVDEIAGSKGITLRQAPGIRIVQASILLLCARQFRIVGNGDRRRIW